MSETYCHFYNILQVNFFKFSYSVEILHIVQHVHMSFQFLYLFYGDFCPQVNASYKFYKHEDTLNLTHQLKDGCWR